MGRIRVSLVVSAVLIAATAVVAEDLNIVALSDVPKVAREAAKKAFPDTQWLVAFADGAGNYKLGGKDAAEHLVEYIIDAGGKKGFFRVEMTTDEVPEVVKEALQREVPGFNVTKAQASGLQDGATTCYRFLGKVGAADEEEVMVSASGRKVVRNK
jgi:hypothetical protein